MAYSYDQIIKRYLSAKANKHKWEDHLRECYRYALPERDVIDLYAPGDKKSQYVFDSTAVDSLEDFATRLESLIVPPGLDWAILEAGSEYTEEQKKEVDKSLAQITRVLFEHIRSSNFSSAIHEAFLDLGVSTGALIIEDGDGIQSGLNFRAINLGELALERSAKGIPETVFRDIPVFARDIPEVWPFAKLSRTLKKMIKDKPDEEVIIIEGVIEDKGVATSVLVFEATKDILFQKIEDNNPWIVFRESTVSGEVYGRGRVMRVLSDVKTLNLMVKDHLKAASFIANPIYMAQDDGVINPYTTSLVPGTVQVVGSNDRGNPSIAPLPQAGDYNILQYDIGKLQDTIRRTLLSKPFGNIEETPVRSATEMSIRNADNAQVSVGASGRIQVELIERLLAVCVNKLRKQGKLPKEMKIDGKLVKIKFTSPAAKRQDEQKIAAVGRFMEFMQVFPPEVINQQIKVEDIPGYIADTLGIPADLKRSDLEKKKMAKAQAQAAGQVAQAEVEAEKEIKNA